MFHSRTSGSSKSKLQAARLFDIRCINIHVYCQAICVLHQCTGIHRSRSTCINSNFWVQLCLLLLCRSASWTARLRSLPSSPSLPVPASPAPVERDRRHTTEEAAHHSGLPDSQGQPVPQPAAQKQPVTQQASHERFASEHWSDRQTTHKEAAVGGEQRNADETSGPPNSVSTSWSNSGILADGQTPGMSHIVDLPGSRQVAAAAADDDLLSFQADPQDTQGVWQGHDSHQQQGNGLLQHEQLGSIQQQGHDALHCDGLGSQSEALNSSTMWRSSLAESQQLSFLEGLSHEWSSSGKHNRQQLSQDPFQFAADTSHEMSHSGRHLSSLGESRGSDLESWGSFLLPDASSNVEADNLQSSLNEPVTLMHAISSASMSDAPAATHTSPLTVIGNGHVSEPEQLSPNACIAKTQRLQLDLFLQSGSSK